MMLDTETDIIYRKEQFREGDYLPEEMIVRDRRYTLEQISLMCEEEGLSVLHAKEGALRRLEYQPGSAKFTRRRNPPLLRKAEG